MKKFMKATEVEVMMQETRNENGFSGQSEKMLVKNLVELAKSNGRIGDKILMVVSPSQIHMPKWQRKADVVRAKINNKVIDMAC